MILDSNDCGSFPEGLKSATVSSESISHTWDYIANMCDMATIISQQPGSTEEPCPLTAGVEASLGVIKAIFEENERNCDFPIASPGDAGTCYKVQACGWEHVLTWAKARDVFQVSLMNDPGTDESYDVYWITLKRVGLLMATLPDEIALVSAWQAGPAALEAKIEATDLSGFWRRMETRVVEESCPVERRKAQSRAECSFSDCNDPGNEQCFVNSPSDDDDFVCGNQGYTEDFMRRMGPIPNALTYGQSLFNFAYTEQQFLADFNRVSANNPNFNLGWAIQNFVYYYGMGFAWPKSVPVAPQVCAYACSCACLLVCMFACLLVCLCGGVASHPSLLYVCLARTPPLATCSFPVLC